MHGKQNIFVAIAAILTLLLLMSVAKGCDSDLSTYKTSKIVSSSGTDLDFSRRPVDEHTAQDFAVKELDIGIVWLSCGKKQELGRGHLGKDLSAYKPRNSALHEPVVDFFRAPNEDRYTQELGTAAPLARKQSTFLPQFLRNRSGFFSQVGRQAYCTGFCCKRA